MVQRKPVCKSGHILIEDNISNRSKEGCDGKKMVKKGRSFKHSSQESQSKKNSPSKSSTGSSPNYMKPTSSSDAKKECLQVSPKSRIYDLSLISKKLQASPKNLRDVAGFKPTKNLSRSSGCRPVRPCLKKSCVVAMHPKHNIGRPTCSSTIKDSKFPAYLELCGGGTEVEGTSVVKVCPYTYCSLNGHYHEPLPPLKCFLAGKRKQLKDQRSRQLNETKMCGEPLEEVDRSIQSQMFVDKDVDFFIEVYAQLKEEYDASSDFDQSFDRSYDMICEESASNNCEKDGEECDEQVLENSLELLQSDMEEMRTSNSVCSAQGGLDEKFDQYPESKEATPVIFIEHKGEEIMEHAKEEDAESCTLETNGDDCFMFDVLWIDEKENQSPEEVLCVEEEEKIDKEVVKFSDHVLKNISNPNATLDLPLFQQEENEQELMDEQNSMEQINTEPAITNQREEIDPTVEDIDSLQAVINIDYSDQDPLPTIGQTSKSEYDAAVHPEEQDKAEQPIIKQEEEEEGIKPIQEPTDRDSYKRKSKMAGEDDEDMDRDFNPRPPNFLPLEPDPDAEKVDLKHQMMDERKNAEEWMVDYALRSTVNKLGPARRRRVELLVEAFETVMPVQKWDSPPPAASCCITHNMPLQACN